MENGIAQRKTKFGCHRQFHPIVSRCICIIKLPDTFSFAEYTQDHADTTLDPNSSIFSILTMLKKWRGEKTCKLPSEIAHTCWLTLTMLILSPSPQ